MTIHMQVRPSKLKELLQTLDELRREKRQMKGFIDSLVFTPNDDNDVLTFVEEWNTQEDLDTYLQSYYFSVLKGAMKVLTSSSEISFTTNSHATNRFNTESALV
jgi:quinol monooxygenase YgiN